MYLWTPATTAPVTIAVRATDSGGATSTKTLEVQPVDANLAPVAAIVQGSGAYVAGREAWFYASATDPDGRGDDLDYAWDTDGDGEFDDRADGYVELTLPAGSLSLGLRVTDADGAATTVRETFLVGTSRRRRASSSPTARPTRTWRSTSRRRREAATARSPRAVGPRRRRQVRRRERPDRDPHASRARASARRPEGARRGRRQRDRLHGPARPLADGPVARFVALPSYPSTGEEVSFTSHSTDPQGDDDIASHAWDLDGDGEFDDADGPLAATTYDTPARTTCGCACATRPVMSRSHGCGLRLRRRGPDAPRERRLRRRRDPLGDRAASARARRRPRPPRRRARARPRRAGAVGLGALRGDRLGPRDLRDVRQRLRHGPRRLHGRVAADAHEGGRRRRRRLQRRDEPDELRRGGGQTYWIAVDGGSGDGGRYRLSLHPPRSRPRRRTTRSRAPPRSARSTTCPARRPAPRRSPASRRMPATAAAIRSGTSFRAAARCASTSAPRGSTRCSRSTRATPGPARGGKQRRLRVVPGARAAAPSSRRRPGWTTSSRSTDAPARGRVPPARAARAGQRQLRGRGAVLRHRVRQHRAGDGARSASPGTRVRPRRGRSGTRSRRSRPPAGRLDVLHLDRSDADRGLRGDVRHDADGGPSRAVPCSAAARGAARAFVAPAELGAAHLPDRGRRGRTGAGGVRAGERERAVQRRPRRRRLAVPRGAQRPLHDALRHARGR